MPFFFQSWQLYFALDTLWNAIYDFSSWAHYIHDLRFFFIILPSLFLLIKGTDTKATSVQLAIRFPVEKDKDIRHLIKLRNKYADGNLNNHKSTSLLILASKCPPMTQQTVGWHPSKARTSLCLSPGDSRQPCSLSSYTCGCVFISNEPFMLTYPLTFPFVKLS